MHHSFIALALLIPGALVAAPAPARPNLIILLADDLGWGDAGFQGATDVKTPNLDRLAESGVRFTQGYVTAPQCIPSRAGLITGRYQQHVGIECNPDDSKNNVYQLPEGVPTLASQLLHAGYRTGMVGKWHLGEPDSTQPFNKGFEWCAYMRRGMGVHFRDSSWLKDEDGEPINWFRDARDQTIPIGGRGYFTETFTDKALEFIEQKDDRPFFLYLSYHPPHWPLDAPAESIAAYRDLADVNRQVCCALISDLDAQIGRLLDHLRSSGQEKNTVVVFLSDNGAPEYSGPQTIPVKVGQNASTNGILSGCKGMLLEGGIRVPFVMAWPGTLPAGKTVDWPVISLDLTPTFLALAGAPPLPDADGVNLMPDLDPEISATGPERALFWRFDTQWSRQNAVRRGTWKLVDYGAPGNRKLFDLAADPSEKSDRAAAEPARATALARELDAWLALLPPPNPEWVTVKKIPAPGE